MGTGHRPGNPRRAEHRTKLFSRAPNRFGDEPNTNITAVCTGQPGALPVLNQRGRSQSRSIRPRRESENQSHQPL